jgi:hypothetical protein
MKANSYLDTDTTTTEDLRQAWGDWLSTLADWDWFVTMTLRDPIGQGTWTKPGWASAKRAWLEFQNLARPALGELTWVRMFELQGWRGVPHVHALVGNIDPTVRRMDLVDWAYRRWGITRVLEYDPNLGARYYLCKYLTKDVADIEFGGLTSQNRSSNV